MKRERNPVKLPGIAIIFAVGAVMAYISWLGWPDILVDYGRELYVPWRLSEGSVLYRDVAYWNGPVTPYLNALLFSVFGTSIRTLAYFNILIVAGITYLIYNIFEEDGETVSTVTLCVTFLTLFAFAQYYRLGSYNYIAPYSHELVHGIFISFLDIYLLKLYLKKKRLWWLFFVGLLTAAALLTKLEIFLALSIAISSGVALGLWAERPSIERLAKIILLLVLGFILPLLITLLALSQVMPVGEALKGMLGSWFFIATTDVGNREFFRRLMGMDALGFNLTRMIISSLWYIAWFGFFAVLSHVLGKSVPLRRYLAIIVFLVAAIVTWFLIKGIWSEILRPLPLVTICVASVFFIVFITRRGDFDKAARIVPFFAFTVFASVMLLKMLFKVHVTHYGFVLAMPATLVLVKVLLSWFPALLNRLSGFSLPYRTAALATVLVTILWHGLIIEDVHARKSYQVGSGSDRFRTYSPQASVKGPVVNETLLRIEALIAPNESVVVLPEGVMLNYLARRRNPTRFITFVPGELVMHDERNILDSFIKASPDYIVITHMDTTEDGHRFFGVNYGFILNGWIKENYSPISLIGAPPLKDNRFGILIMKRNEVN